MKTIFDPKPIPDSAMIVIKGKEIAQLQDIVDQMPTQYGRVFDAFFAGVGKRRMEEAEQAKMKVANIGKDLTIGNALTQSKASETATGINGSELKASDTKEQ